MLPPGPWSPRPSVMVALVLVVGALDFALARVGWAAIALSSVTTVLLVPWAAVLFRKDRADPDRSRGSLAARGLTAVAVLLVLSAKWIAVERLLHAPEYVQAYRTYSTLLTILFLAGLALRVGRIARLLAASAEHPTRLSVLSFALAAGIGALVLSLPVSLQRPSEVSLLDSLFMATSAVCVTGLATLNVAGSYTFAGQVVLCTLMQIGGLGIMVLSASLTMLAGRRLGLKSSVVLADTVDLRSIADLRRTIAMIVAYTFVFESIGALLLYLQLRGMPGALWAAVFHAVSGFTNASLSNFPNGMQGYAGAPGVCQTLAALILLGGLGFPVIHELAQNAVCRLRNRRTLRVSLNTRLAVFTSLILLGGVAVAYLVLERASSFASLGFGASVNAAVFQSACSRTAGFNVVDVATMRPATLLLTCGAMFIGGSPGSTAGGIKTTTLAVLFAALRGELRHHKPRLLDRSVPYSVVRRAMGVALLALALVSVVVFLLVLVEKHAMLALTFEVVSAFSTTGLSTGITPTLSAAGKLLIVLTMLIGRVGPLTAAMALSAEARPPAYELPEERVMIG